MINVFKNRTRLCAVTTSVLFFLQGVDVSMGDDKATSVPAPASAQVISSTNECVLSPSSDDDSSTYSPIKCLDQTLTVKGGMIVVGTGEDDADGVDVEGSKANVKIEGTSIWGAQESEREGEEEKVDHVRSAVYAQDDAFVELDDVDIRTLDSAVETDNGAVVIMRRGIITETGLGVRGDGESFIFLDKPDITVSGQAIYARDRASVTVKSGKLSFSRGNIGVSADDGASIKLQNVAIKVEGKENEEDVDQAGTAVFASQDGFISFDNGQLDVSDVVAFSVGQSDGSGSSEVDSGKGAIKDVSNEPVAEILKAYVDPGKDDFNSLYSAEEMKAARKIYNGIYGARDAKKKATEEALLAMQKIVNSTNASDLKVGASIQSSIINVSGAEGVGIEFNKGEDDKQRKGQEGKGNSGWGRTVVLEKAILSVPKGVAIYGYGLQGTVFLKENSKIAGGRLLEAKSSSHLSVVARDSVIAGDVFLDNSSTAKFFLSEKSAWHLTTSTRPKLVEERNCADVCITSLNLKDSTLKFMNPRGSKANSGNYRTLFIGEHVLSDKKNGQNTQSQQSVVYSAEGNSWIHFNVGLGRDRASVATNNKRPLSDRLIIHGNVSGTTTVHIIAENGVLKNAEGVSTASQEGVDSISLIQVYGTAQKNSFQLNGQYITLNGLPYQYTLHAYGPYIPAKQVFFDKQLLPYATQFWDFRLENKDSKNKHGGFFSSPPYVSAAASSTPPTRDKISVVIKSIEDTAEDEEDAEDIVEVLDVISAEDAEEEGKESEGLESTDPRSASPENASSGLPVARVLLVNSEPSPELASLSLATPSLPSRGDVSVTSTSPSSLARSDTGDIPIVPASSVFVYQVDSLTNSELVVPNASSAVVMPPSAQPKVPSIGSVARLGNVGTENVSSQCNDTGRDAAGKSRVAYSCSDGKSYTMKNLTLKASDKAQHPMHAKNQNTVIKLEGATISGGHSSDYTNNVDLTKLQAVSAVLAEEGAEVVLEKKSTVNSSLIGLEAQKGGKVKMDDGTVDVGYVGALAGSRSSVELSNTKINVSGDLAVAALASDAGEITMKSGAITLTSGVAVRSESGGRIKLDKVDITARKEKNKLGSAERFGSAAFLLNNNGSVDFTNGNVVTNVNALWIKRNDDIVETSPSRRKRSADVRSSMNHASIESSTVRVEGDKSYGIYFDGTGWKGVDQQNRNKDIEKTISESSMKRSEEKSPVEKVSVVKRNAVPLQEKTPIGIMGTVSLKKTDFEVSKSIAIYGNHSGGRISLENETTLSGDLLLKAENNSNILISADRSIVVGGARIDKGSYAKLDLTNGSEWHLRRSAQKNLSASDPECVDSCVSSVSLVNSRIDFAPSEAEELKYQTLRIGRGEGVVYEARGNAEIYLNAHLNPSDSNVNQVTDRLLIHGNVSGKTVVHVRGVSGNITEKDRAHSVSIIQVYGNAQKDSFQLSSDYVTLGNSPYKYTLRSYGPEATSAQEHVQQKFMNNGGNFWNFRLENQYVKPSRFAYTSTISKVGFASYGERVVRSVVPQVPTYLLLPNSVFHAGLMDINNQNKQFDLLRKTFSGKIEARENPGLYLRGYGGSYSYASDLSALEYGYKGDLNYNGVEAGALLHTIENADSAVSFGVMGTYGKLSLQPLDVEQSQKSAFDKWTATAYGSMQHDAGFYVDGLLSYGVFKGDVLTLARGKTATLKANPFGVSLTGGKAFATGYEGFVVDPQVQVVYQHLHFDKTRDIDHFDIEMGKLDQWVARVGGRLIKTPTGPEGVRAVSFYSKLYLAHGFGEKQSVHFKDAFQLGAFGSSLEAGLGFNAKLSQRFALHGDIVYQHQLNKAGFSGASFSGGVRYQF
ncbi:autotransporter outer membrane beta-barrel domain-containing protein [Bartonella sp. 220]|uniref:autotransporter outer membrane beta-barrel domain-containing protein n=1 Tax=Bartonella sp. 220B TaxID=2967260 RepID=UPI0022A8E543|nr:autotransporter outer membrane beta-barrel domain-containing protein [Bartonella sp. 220B]MCZ2159074.1 autotransporter outer membrane beta-barrel domain-containing protein [Bartonella sp. 220B]